MSGILVTCLPTVSFRFDNFLHAEFTVAVSLWFILHCHTPFFSGSVFFFYLEPMVDTTSTDDAFSNLGLQLA